MAESWILKNFKYEGRNNIVSCKIRQNFYIATNCFDKIGYLSKSYFQITVHEKLRVNDQWLQAKKTNVKLHMK